MFTFGFYIIISNKFVLNTYLSALTKNLKCFFSFYSPLSKTDSVLHITYIFLAFIIKGL